ncbi:sensor histidine kinase [Streptomyces sp. NRRL S-31]|uniref:sensor histidine kinase n=1 Tax=Streptomyces sp. NRRL S-31 TaxID=1463898 RepID=UPI0009A0E26A|nr:sensor histidine kinase [Streptomyces sp. NRRL S-31]
MTRQGRAPSDPGRRRNPRGAERRPDPSHAERHPAPADRRHRSVPWRVERVFALRGGEWAFAVVGLPFALCGGVYALAVLYAGALLSLTVLGLPFVAAALLGARGAGAPHRWLVGRLLGEHVEAPAAPPRPAGAVARGRALLTDPVAWRTLLYLLLRLPLGVLGFAAAVALPLGCGWLIGFPLWGRLLEAGPPPAIWPDVGSPLLGLALLATVPGAVRALSGANRRLARVLLGPARAQRRVRHLEAARATLLAENTDRLRRLERDLHDGTQARLVALAVTLALVDDALPPAPGPDLGRLRALVDRARGQTDDTIAELRRLTRGIHPAALDGGLGEALPGLAATSPVPVTVRLDLRERPDRTVERAVYFCAAELLTNIARHSGARSAELTVSAAGGRGGAATGAGTGLSGLAERLAAVDGVLRLDSPPGGPTTVTAELPARL